MLRLTSKVNHRPLVPRLASTTEAFKSSKGVHVTLQYKQLAHKWFIRSCESVPVDGRT